ncbi:MFS transporter [Nocardioides ferulae]|uniref:MFS transporter n=1 Tax=Nocardioides ferulae TaxID=2340821 RepID=UPI000EB2A0C2|nr:MFS transporter [Nocardioides ferulae]
MSPLASYRRLFALTGPLYVLVAFVGRLPLAMSQMGTLLLVSDATGSYGTGGLAAGALAVTNAVGAPFAGMLADRHGQRPVVLTQSLVGAAALAGLVAIAGNDRPAPVLVAVAAGAGLALPQVGPLARVRWRPITERPGQPRLRLMDAAFSYEGAADEASFVLGPALVGMLVVLVSPPGAVLTAAVLLAVFGTAFALHPTARMTRASGPRTAGGGGLPRLLFALLPAMLCVGILFGATQTGTTALAAEVGRPGVAGLVHSLLGVGSVLAGLATVLLPERLGHERRLLVAAAALLVLSAPLLAVDSLLALVLVVLALGFGVAPYMISVFTLGERILPGARVAMGMTLIAGAAGVGYAVGAAVAGQLADRHGHQAAFAVTVAATVLAVLVSAALQRPARHALERARAERASL